MSLEEATQNAAWQKHQERFPRFGGKGKQEQEFRAAYRSGLDAASPPPSPPAGMTLGAIATEIRAMKERGITRASIEYVLDRVYDND